MKLFLQRIAFLIPFFFILGGTNYLIDDQLVFHKEKLNKAVDWLQAGDTVYGLTHVHKPYFHKRFVKTSCKRRDVIVLGASDCSHIGGDYFQGKETFTHWGPGTGLFFQVAMIKLYQEKDILPKELVLSMRPNVVESHAAKTAEYFSQAFNEKVRTLGLTKLEVKYSVFNHIFTQLKKLFSAKYLMYNLNTSKHEIGRVKNLEEPFIMLPDGSVMNNFIDLRSINQKVIQQVISTYTKAYEKPNPSLVELQQKVIRELSEKGVKVSFFILPFHPLVFEDKDFRLAMTRWEKELKQYSKNLGVSIIGGVDPQDFNLMASDFEDVTHISRGSMSKVFYPKRNSER